MPYIAPSFITALSWWRVLCNSVKLWAMPCRVTQDEQVKVKSSGKIRSTGGENGKPLQYSCCKNPINNMKRQKDMTPEDEPPPLRSEGVQYTTGEKWRAITKSSRKNEAAGPKQKQCSVVDVSDDGVKNNTAYESEMSGPWIKVNSDVSMRRQEWTLTS